MFKKYITHFQSNTLLITTSGFILGIAIFSNGILVTMGIIMGIFLRKLKFVLFLACLIIGLLFASYTYHSGIKLSYTLNQRVAEIKVNVVEPQQIGKYGSQLVVSLDNLSGNFILFTNNKNQLYSVNDVLKVRGKIESIEFDTKINPEYKSYLFFKNVQYKMNNPQITKLENSLNFASIGSKIKNEFTYLVNRHLPSQASAFTTGIIFGAKENLDDNFEETLRTTGTSHLISASGSNLQMVYVFIMSFAGIISVKRLRILSSILIVFYLAIIGSHVLPAQRATIMILFIIIGQTAGRKSNFVNALMLSICFILLQYPFYYLNISMQLSVAATVGIFILAKPINKFFAKMKIPRILSENISASLGATVATLPFSLIYFGNLSSLSVVLNALVLPLIAPLTIFSLIGIAMAILNISLLSSLAFAVCYLIWSIFETLVIIFDFLEKNISSGIKISLLILTLALVLLIIVYENIFKAKKHLA